MNARDLTIAALVLSLSIGSAPVRAAEARKVVDHAELQQAVSAKTAADEASRGAIRSLLHRADVRAMAGEMGLDLKRAEGSVATLEGPDLERVALRAAAANDLLIEGSGGTIQISVVTLLLIIIIVILLAR